MELGVIRILIGLNLLNNFFKEFLYSVVERGVYVIKYYLLIKFGVNLENFKYDVVELKYYRIDSLYIVNVEKKNNCRDGIDIL